ncbi:hypothetical protein GAYE_SCF56G6400 [Galdieria yellowstonensis]|uniref:1-acyl-sn-glycerol-3-phosphate acyltransferase n=1 Tax=Galdieria yellowstonensis TaxID=3028027 RepID=A0AAV9ILW1_9RHOD|nr:hypothetical protein GAYE_SCF56G6400 [Galdieria yellowstonensis]
MKRPSCFVYPFLHGCSTHRTWALYSSKRRYSSQSFSSFPCIVLKKASCHFSSRNKWWNLVMKQSDDSVEKKRLSLFGVCFLVITYWWAVVLFPLFTALFPITWVMDRVRRRLLDKIAFLWMRLTLFCCRVRVVIQGEENLPTVDRPVMYVANHQSFLDIYVLSALKPKFKFVSKIEVFSYPIIGWAMALAGYVGLKRGDSRRQLQTYREIVRKLESGISLVMFPEGTRSVHGKLLPFKIGPFKAAKQAHVPIVPLTIVGTREVMPSFAWLPIAYPRKPIVIHVHPMIQVENYEDKQLADICKSVIEKPLESSSSSSSTTWNWSPL